MQGDMPDANEDEPVILKTWDFGGQHEYYVMHHLFITNRGSADKMTTHPGSPPHRTPPQNQVGVSFVLIFWGSFGWKVISQLSLFSRYLMGRRAFGWDISDDLTPMCRNNVWRDWSFRPQTRCIHSCDSFGLMAPRRRTRSPHTKLIDALLL
eukprot:4536578-Amphidinium_carterae.1